MRISPCVESAILDASRRDTSTCISRYRGHLLYYSDLEMWMRLAKHTVVARPDTPLIVPQVRGGGTGDAQIVSMARGYLPRTAAFDAVIGGFGEQIADSRRLLSEGNRDLAEQSFWARIAQLCRGSRRGGRELLALACEFYPELRVQRPMVRLFSAAHVGRKIREALGAAYGGLERHRAKPG